MLRSRALYGFIKGACAILITLSFIASFAHTMDAKQVLILVAKETGWFSGFYNSIAMNIVEEAKSDFSSLGYTATIQFSPTVTNALKLIRGRPDPIALVIIAHGDKDTFCLLDSSKCLHYSALEPSVGWGKQWEYVILHACYSDNKNSRAEFRAPGFFKG